ncbi:hypothetical protein BaRGS_00014639, partial [Batillaria attramentaria]
DDTVVCSTMTLPHAASSLSWRYKSLTYQPHEGFHGFDTVRFVATDEGGLGSFVLTVKFAVMERPCENDGVCESKDTASYTCDDSRRAESFDMYYVCNCISGYSGLHCDDDFNDCYSNPCSYPYVCYDRVDSYVCACASDDPECDGLEGWMIALIVIACLLVVVLVLLALYIWAVRTGRIKWSLFRKKKRPGSGGSRGSSSGPPPTPPADYQFTNKAFDDDGGGPLFSRTNTPNLPPVLHALHQQKRPSMDTRGSSPDLPSTSTSHSFSISLDSPHNYNADHIYRPMSQEQMSVGESPWPDSHLLGALIYDPLHPSRSTPSSPYVQRRPRSGTAGSADGAHINHAWANKRKQFLQPDYLPPMSTPLSRTNRSASEVQVFMHGKRAGHRKSSDAISIGSAASHDRPMTPVE